MWNVLLKRSRLLIDTLRNAPERVATTARLAVGTGILWELTVPGTRELVRILWRGSQNPAQIYRLHGINSPDKIALIYHDRALTWGEVDARIDRLAAGLTKRGITKGKSLLVMMRNSIEFVEIGAAASRLGASAVTISWRSTAKELAYLASDSGAVGLVIDEALLPVIEHAKGELPDALIANLIVVSTGRALAEPAGYVAYESLLDNASTRVGRNEPDAIVDDDASLVIYTSGTTGKPKGAVRKFPKDTMNAAFRFINETPFRVDDIHLVACPLYHTTAFGFMSFSLLLGNTVVLMDDFKPEAFLQTVQRHRITTTAVVPTMLHRVLELPQEVRMKYSARSLRTVIVGGAPLPTPQALSFMDEFGDVLYQFYGATETGLVTLASPADMRAAPGTIGKALPGNSIRLLDDDGRDVPAGKVGELYVKNQLLVAGYHGNEAETRASMRDGYFSVGDLARCDDRGRYFLEGRKRDMVISGGVNVYPAEVEGVLEHHPDIAEVAIVGMPDAEWGERVCAFVVLKPGRSVDAGALKAFTREKLAGPKVPRDFIFLDTLPRNPTGKVLKRQLHDVYAKK